MKQYSCECDHRIHSCVVYYLVSYYIAEGGFSATRIEIFCVKVQLEFLVQFNINKTTIPLQNLVESPKIFWTLLFCLFSLFLIRILIFYTHLWTILNGINFFKMHFEIIPFLIKIMILKFKKFNFFH